MAEPKQTENENVEGTMPLLSHLDELRSRMFKAVVAFVVALIACLTIASRIVDVLMKPVRDVLPEDSELVFVRLAEPFLTQLKAAALLAVFVAAPFILYQAWAFIAPGLYRHERKWIVPFLAFGTLFFAAGGVFGYFVVTPVTARWLISVGGDFPPLISLREAFGFVAKMVLGLGLVFELPVLIFFLARIGVVTPAFLWRHIRIVVLLIAVLSAMLTPPDPVSLGLFAIPMVLLYLVGIAVAWAAARRDG